MRELTVVKKNGRRAPFDRDKLQRSVEVALRKRAVAPERVERMINGIVRQLEAQGDADIPTERIGELVMEGLKTLDDVAYVRFASVYRNFREARDFNAIVGELERSPSPRRRPNERRCALDGGRAGARAAQPRPTRAKPVCRRADRQREPRHRRRRHGARRTSARRDRALAEAGEAARGATLYVTLEPCSHHGATPPCAEAIVAAGVAACRLRAGRPGPARRGAGPARSCARQASRSCSASAPRRARRDHLGHILRVTEGRPMVTLKIARTADGYAAGDEHDPRLAITGEAANRRMQRFARAMTRSWSASARRSPTIRF